MFQSLLTSVSGIKIQNILTPPLPANKDISQLQLGIFCLWAIVTILLSLSTWWSIVSINVHQRCQRNQTKANKMMLMKTAKTAMILATIMMRQTSSNCSLWSGVMTVRWNANYIQFKSLYLESGSWIFKYHQAGPDFRSIFAYAESNMMILSLSCARQRLLSVGLVCTRYSACFLDTFF